jgi:cell division protease FtsH
LLAKAIAGETNATFFSISGSEFVELYVGMGASKVRNLFEEARENVPAIIFIDEIDAVGKKRGSANVVNPNDEREQTLNQLLSEMDGFNLNTGIIVIAATNRRDVLDDALLRPGRFDRLIYVPLPDRISREAILRLYLKNKNTSNDISVSYLAENTGGFSGAQIKNLLNEAAIYAARNGEIIITNDYIDQALEKILVGITKRLDTRTDYLRRRVAIHEIGHALLAAEFQNDFDLKKVSMKTTYNGIGGYTLFNEYPDVQESGLYTKDLLLKRIIVSLGGKAAETIEYGENFVSVGSSEDLKQANELAREMIYRYGMGKNLEVFSQNRLPYSDRILDLIDKESMDIVQQCYDEAKIILSDKYQKLHILMNLLLAENVLDGKTVIDIVHDRLNNSYIYE